jgi:hypothetical protein
MLRIERLLAACVLVTGALALGEESVGPPAEMYVPTAPQAATSMVAKGEGYVFHILRVGQGSAARVHVDYVPIQMLLRTDTQLGGMRVVDITPGGEDKVPGAQAMGLLPPQATLPKVRGKNAANQEVEIPTTIYGQYVASAHDDRRIYLLERINAVLFMTIGTSNTHIVASQLQLAVVPITGEGKTIRATVSEETPKAGMTELPDPVDRLALIVKDGTIQVGDKARYVIEGDTLKLKSN